ncbi:right-handed parallel beta-helix repeat-containing protein [Streptacidiphilus griseoplanus]|uniref:right-handed parallel beta-helix repeat-containing protein n=1 Tax=Peterkaempfera griseoplana TaxID=66896 RepID=UPI00099F375F|nr:right-handed parallel beta-helix repeat-containing protein [Peterkaempfera griseoplana]
MRHRKFKYAAGAAGVSALAVAAAAGVGALDLGGSTPSGQDGTVRAVPQGGSIQQVVDLAKPGDTVTIPAGIFHGSVQVRTAGITLQGAGPATVITPDAQGGSGDCAKQGHGICVTGTAGHRLTGVRIMSLSVSGFTKDGLMATETDGLLVRGVQAVGNGEHGIRQDKSVRGVFQDNTARNNKETGIFLANTVSEEGGATDDAGALVSGNHVSGNRIGITLRRLRNLTVEHNTVTDNCGGIFVVGDEGVPRAGHLTVRDNQVRANNRSCAATPRLPTIQGAGIVLTGVEQTTVTGNDIRDNKGTVPMSGGIVLYPSVVGIPNKGNIIERNTLKGNKTADLADRDKGTGNVFARNACTVSEPTGRC